MSPFIYNRLIRPLLFSLEAEKAHHLSLAGLKLAHDLHLAKWLAAPMVNDPVEIMGLTFPNRVGLAAGMDKTASCVGGFGDLGFGHIEVGTLTPRPQPGNPQPRLFRLKEHQAIINRMGFNNPGIEAGMASLMHSRRRYQGIVGVNIGKNFDTPNAEAIEDYRIGLRAAYTSADYIAINLSSPNTKGLRDLQAADAFGQLLETLVGERDQLAKYHAKSVPLAVKLAPDLSSEELQSLGKLVMEIGVDAIIATNTTLSREAVNTHPRGGEAGGLSGAPVSALSTQAIRVLRAAVGKNLPIFGVGGIMHAADAAEKMLAGADLVQLYTGFVYRGAPLIHETAESSRLTARQDQEAAPLSA